MSLDMETAGNRLGKNQDLPAGMLWDGDTLCICSCKWKDRQVQRSTLDVRNHHPINPPWQSDVQAGGLARWAARGERAQLLESCQ